MSENIEPTQSSEPIKEDDTQPLKPITRTPRWRSILIAVLGFILLVGLGGFGGYFSGIGDRKTAQESVLASSLWSNISMLLWTFSLAATMRRSNAWSASSRMIQVTPACRIRSLRCLS